VTLPNDPSSEINLSWDNRELESFKALNKTMSFTTRKKRQKLAGTKKNMVM
jgi:hypothetical protein